MKKKISLLGSTGSIGTQTLDVIGWFPEDFSVVALTAEKNWQLLAAQAHKWRPQVVAIGDTTFYEPLRDALTDIECLVLAGNEGILTCATWEEASMVVGAISGVAGLEPVAKALAAGKELALANKEVLVAAGHLIMELVRQRNAILLPVDSEHSAIFQCLAGAAGGAASLLLTASGGPFRKFNREQLAAVTPSMALKHPTWQMGQKITIDSATLMNKGLEIIEAHWLFDISYDNIQAVIHPQSIIHSMVQMVDGALLAHMGYPDMRVPIQFALTWPVRRPNPLNPINFATLGQLTFQKVDEELFPCLALAKEAGRCGGSLPTVLNAANEVLVEKFLAGKIGFLDIPRLIEQTMAQHKKIENPDLPTILAIDRESRRIARELAAHY